jgi:hypothetical protein
MGTCLADGGRFPEGEMHGSRVIYTFVVLGVAAAIPIARSALANPIVWVIDDGEKIKQDTVELPLATGVSNPAWSPGAPVRLSALRNETVALQVVVQADAAEIDGLTVDVGPLAGPVPAPTQNDAGATDPTSFVGRPLIPVEVVPTSDPYPMHVAANRKGAVWIDVTIPGNQAPGTYRGVVSVAAAGRPLASLPIELDVLAASGPDGGGAGQAAGGTGMDGSTADASVGYGDDTVAYGVPERPVGPSGSGPTGAGCSTGGASGGERGVALEIACALLAIVGIRRKWPAERTPALRHGNGCAGRPRSK